MQAPELNETVRLARSVPELFLASGAEGIVQSVWFAPTPAYEVEFRSEGGGYPIRALLLPEYLQQTE